jgi:ABC-type bacteriocin/lantibiotic exporter with double-glycine peptidase domain
VTAGLGSRFAALGVATTLFVAAAVSFRPADEVPVSRTDEVRQWSHTTCGAAAVATVLNVYRRPWGRAALASDCETTPQGSSMLGLRDACRRHGLRAEGVQARTAAALTRLSRPFIAYLAYPAPGEGVGRHGHFVVVQRFSGGRFVAFDPAIGLHGSWSAEELFAQGRGWALTCRPG